MKKGNCLLAEPVCEGNCGKCGWDKETDEERKKQLAKQGLTLCEDGLRRLVVKREEAYG